MTFPFTEQNARWLLGVLVLGVVVLALIVPSQIRPERVVIEPPSPGFEVGVSPSSLSILQGGVGRLTVTLTSLRGFNELVSLSLEELLVGVSVVWENRMLLLSTNETVETFAFLSVSNTAVPGQYILRLGVAGGGRSQLLEVGLQIVAVPPPQPEPVKITLLADHRGWNFSTRSNPRISLAEGREILMRIIWADDRHNFAIYPEGYRSDSVYVGNPVALFRSGVVSEDAPILEFRFRLSAGSYEYYCEFHPNRMHGDLNVSSSNNNSDD